MTEHGPIYYVTILIFLKRVSFLIVIFPIVIFPIVIFPIVCPFLTFLVNLLYHFVSTIEDTTCWGTTCETFWRLSVSFDGTSRTEIMSTASNNRVCVMLATYETSKGYIFFIRTIGGTFMTSLVFCQFVQLPTCEIYGERSAEYRM